MRGPRLIGLLMAIVGSLDVARAAAPTEKLYSDYLDGVSTVDNSGVGLQLGVFDPLWEDAANLFFADIRGYVEYHDGVDFNWGLGWRHRAATDWIVGGYGYFDRTHSAERNRYSQAMFGVELLSERLAFRINGYLPESDIDNLSEPVAIVRGGQIVIERSVEGAYAGTDFEAGALLHSWLEGQLELRGYVGGYVFGRSESSFEQIAGPRARMELRLFDWELLGRQSRLVLHGQYQWDQVRGSQGLVSAALRVAFGKNRGPVLSRRDRRMVTPVVRMPGALTHIAKHWEPTGTISGQSSAVHVVSAATVDLPAAIRDLGPGSVVLLDSSDGPFEVSEAIVLQDNQVILGEVHGLDLAGANTGAPVAFTGAENRPEVVGTSPFDNVFELPGQGGAIIGLDVLGGKNGIYGNHSRDAIIVGNRIGYTFHASEYGANNGILLDKPRGEILIGANAIGEHRHGVEINGPFAGRIVNNLILQNRSFGVVTGGDAEPYGSVTGSIEANRFVENGISGLNVNGNVYGDVVGNEAIGNVDSGLQLDGEVHGDLIDNVATDNGYAGIGVVGLVHGDLRGNVAANNEHAGIHLRAGLTGDLLDNTASENTLYGIVANQVGGVAAGNQVEGNGAVGMMLRNPQGDVRGNSAIGNGIGLKIEGDIQGDVLDNRLEDNSLDGMLLELIADGDVLVRGNEFVGNHGQVTEFTARMLSGHSGPATLTLKDNISEKVIPAHLRPNFHIEDSDIQLIDGGGNVGRIGR